MHFYSITGQTKGGRKVFFRGSRGRNGPGWGGRWDGGGEGDEESRFLTIKEDLPNCTLTVILSLEHGAEKRTLQYEKETRHKIQNNNPVKQCVNRIQHMPEQSC